MNLTPKQEKFAQLVASGVNQSEAYRQVYNVAKMNGSTINREAHTLTQNHNVATRIAELRQPALKKLEYTIESHVKRMQELQEFAMQCNQPGAAIKAEENIGKVLGLYTQKTEISGPGGGPLDIQLVKKIIKK